MGPLGGGPGRQILDVRRQVHLHFKLKAGMYFLDNFFQIGWMVSLDFQISFYLFQFTVDGFYNTNNFYIINDFNIINDFYIINKLLPFPFYFGYLLHYK